MEGSIGDCFKVVEKIPLGGRSYQNIASLSDILNFLGEVYRLNPSFENESSTLGLMSIDKNRRLTPRGDKSQPEGAVIANKTGTTGYTCADSAVVKSKDYKGDDKAYSIVIAVTRKYGSGRENEKISSSRCSRKLISAFNGIHNIASEAFDRKYDLAYDSISPNKISQRLMARSHLFD